MHTAVISQIRPGSSRAHAINVFKTAGGFARLGHDVTVYCLAPEPTIQGDPGTGYHETRFTWCFAPPGPATDSDEGFGRWAAAKARAARVDLVYARNFWGPIIAAQMGLPTVFESHAYPDQPNPLLRRALRATVHQPTMRAAITIAPVLRDNFIRLGADPARVHVVPDGVDIELFTRPAATPFRRPGPHVVYAGHLYDYKGIPTVLEAAALAPDCQFHLVGGLDNDISRARARVRTLRLANVRVHGRVDHAEVPPWTQHADVLLLPPSAREPSKDWTSPVKLGEYLASGPPIVASAIPALRRVLHDQPICWFEPDDAASLAQAVHQALTQRTDADGRSRRLTRAHDLSYPMRARRILEAARMSARSAAA